MNFVINLVAFVLAFNVARSNIVCKIKNNQNPKDYKISDAALNNLTVNAGHSKSRLQVFDCTCDSDVSYTLLKKNCFEKKKGFLG